MFDRYSLGITAVLMAFIAALMGIHLLQAQDEGVTGMNDHYQVTVQPVTIRAGEPFTLDLSITEMDGETAVSDFDEVHEKLLHLILISEDLTQFLHVHPDYQGEGRFVLKDAVVPTSGSYIAFADFTPTGEHQQVVRLALPTEGAEAATPDLALSETEYTAAPLRFGLQLPETLNAGEETTIGFHVTDAESGEPVETLDEYLGAAGHLVIVDERGQVYLHTHPAEDEHDMGGMAGMDMEASYGPDIAFMTEFPAPSLYALWLQVQYQGEVYTAPFVIDVTGAAAPEPTGEAGGSH